MIKKLRGVHDLSKLPPKTRKALLRRLGKDASVIGEKVDVETTTEHLNDARE